MSDTFSNQPLAEQTFFTDPALDRAMGVVMALAAEVWVLKDRVHALESVLEHGGYLQKSEIDSHQPGATDAATIATERDAFINALMVNLLGQQQSKGIRQ